MEIKSGIYMWTSPSGKHYIGQAVNLKRRKNDFLNFNRKYTSDKISSTFSAIDKARNKYRSASNWKYEVLEFVEIDKLNELEIKYISKYQTTDSKKGYNCTNGGDGTKGNKWGTEKQIEALKNRRSYAAYNNPNFGNHLSNEAKNRIRKAHLGTKQSIEIVLKRSKAVIQLSMNGEFIKVFNSITEAANTVGCDKSLIMRVCQGKKKSAKGYIWKYKN